MKNIKYIILIFIISVNLYGCKQEVNQNASVENMINSMKTVENFKSGTLEDLKNQEIAEKYGITKEDIEEGFVYYPNKEERADKIILIKAKDKSNIEDIERTLSSEIIGLTDSWENNEQESKKIENHIFKTRDLYVLLYVGENPEQIETIFDNALKVNQN